MDWLTVIAVAVALGTDAFSLAMGMGLSGLRRRTFVLFPTIVAIFHVFMPLIGMFAGHVLGELIGQVANIAGGIILIFIGARTLYKSFFADRGESFSFASARQAFRGMRRTPTDSLGSLLVLATGVSLDALSVGFGLGTLGARLIGAVLTMGLIAGSMTLIGLILGNRLGDWLGKRAENLGGLILILIGFKIML
ncbi:MAG TPA: manganese efflux pump [Candidatus Deferrimicrobium sp.]|nr:manganese efflux pump [Candidatus Deferrimicrobium sp.]